MADGAMGYMFLAMCVAVVAVAIFIGCVAWLAFILLTFKTSTQRRKWIFAFAPLTLFVGVGLFFSLDEGARNWALDQIDPPKTQVDPMTGEAH